MLPPMPWKVVRHNQKFKDGFRPVDLEDRNGKRILRICDDGDDRGLASYFEKIINLQS